MCCVRNALSGLHLRQARARRTGSSTVRAHIPLLAAEANCELHDSGIGCRADDAAECRGAEASVWLCAGGCVGYIEQLGAEFQPSFMEERGVLAERQIEVSKRWTADRIARSGSDGELRCGRKSGGVEEVSRGSIIRRERRPADEIWALGGEACEGVEVRCLRYRDRHPRLQRHNCVKLPPAEECIGHPP